jgi:hypothetical protein
LSRCIAAKLTDLAFQGGERPSESGGFGISEDKHIVQPIDRAGYFAWGCFRLFW